VSQLKSEGNGIPLTPLRIGDIPVEGNVEELRAKSGQKVNDLTPGSGKGISTSRKSADSGDC